MTLAAVGAGTVVAVSMFLAALPLVMVMIAGPQIVSAVLLATSERAKACSVAFLVGVAVATSIAVGGWYLLVSSLTADDSGTGEGYSGWIDVVIPIVLVVLAIHVFLTRKTSKPPKWMGRLQEARPHFAFGLGFLLFLLMPTDLITTFTVASSLVRQGLDWWWGVAFVAVTVLAVGVPLWIVLLFGHRAEVALPKIREWMTTNSWIISEGVIVFFVLISLQSL